MAYIGKSPSQAVRNRYYFTQSSNGATSLSGSDDASNTLTFADGNYVDVLLNGVTLVAGTDYNTSTANTIAGLSALSSGDVVQVIVYDTFSVFSGNVNGDFTVGGDIVVSGTVDSRDVNADGTKLDGIEASADVTDSTNVASAGAAMLSGATFTGNVGVQGSSGATLSLTSTDTSGADTELLGQIDFVSSDASTGSAGTQARIKGVYEDNGDSSGIAFFTGNSTGSGTPTINEVMRLRHEGNVRINDVIDNLTGTLTLNGRNTGNIIFQSGGAEKMRLDSGGNLGIGTTSASGKLTVNKGSAGTLAAFTDGVNSNFVVETASLITTVGNTGGSTALAFKSSNTERMRLTSGGALAIATTSPESQAKLQANGPAIFIHNHTDTSSSGNVSYLAGNQALTLVNAEAGANNRCVKLGFSIPTLGANSDGLIEYGSTAAGSGEFRFYTESGNTLGNRMTINSNGQVGINGTAGQGGTRFHVEDSGGGGQIRARYNSASNGFLINQTGQASGVYLLHQDNNPLIFGTNNVEVGRFDNGGNLFVGKTSDSQAGIGLTLSNSGFIRAVRNEISGVFHRTSSDGSVILFERNSTGVGTIGVTTSATSFNTSSDRRLKSNIKDAASASDKIDAIQVRQFDWNVDGHHQDYGLIAQELQPIEPMAVTGDADSDEMMGVDYSKLVPMLIKFSQEQQATIKSLETRLAALENA